MSVPVTGRPGSDAGAADAPAICIRRSDERLDSRPRRLALGNERARLVRGRCNDTDMIGSRPTRQRGQRRAARSQSLAKQPRRLDGGWWLLLGDSSSVRSGSRCRSSPSSHRHRRPAGTTPSIRALARRLQAPNARCGERQGCARARGVASCSLIAPGSRYPSREVARRWWTLHADS